ncbi:testis anion transporter 1 isoform X2 [Diceros bicornis minor]|uniref:testis anion transporter 1 isoform X2 n=1 Tax=Diceros bicornis minor TaxID=77932 RepID=UPI0026EEEA3D|nr:testis anion transporter 1 isoform X2 [Diceros bicornis minor]
MMQLERSSQGLGSRYRQNSFTYDVKRDVYNEETFQQEHRRKTISSGNVDINITTFRHHVQCRCSWHKFRRCMTMIFPFLKWMCLYRFKDWLLGDLLAGISVGLVQIPQGLMFSLLARQLVPPLNVSYAAFCASVIYVILGSCHQMSIGAFFLVSALMINVLKLHPFNSGHLVLGTFLKDDFSKPAFFVAYNRSLSVVASTTFLTGIIQILGFTVFANKINMATETSGTLIDMIPYSFLFPVMPDLDILPEIILQAFSLAIVSSSLLIFLGKKIASFHNYNVNSNQDLIAIGLCNVVSSFFRSCVFTGAVIRTIIQDKCGGRQQFASLVGAGLMLLLMVKAGRFFYKLPNAVLAGIMLSNLLPYLETIYNLPDLWRQNQYDCVIWMVTFTSAVFLGLDVGLLVSIAFAFFLITVRSHRTKILLLGQIPNTNIYRSIKDYREITNIPGVKIFQCCNSITFVNVHHLKHKLLKEVEMVRVPLKEEEVFGLFNQNEDGSQEGKICRCFCNCDELEPPPRVVYTERYESKQEHDSSSINLIRCSRFESVNESQAMSNDQVPYTASSMSQRNQGQNYEGVEKVWLPNNSSRNSLMPLPDAAESQVMSRSLIRYSDMSLPPSTHTIILDFSMVQFVDAQASVVLRQMCNAFQNAYILVLIAGCHSSVVRAFERNDFFDTGITKAQLFLTLHDAVLFALSRNFPESSELSVDESETVIRETYSETDKNGESRNKMSSSVLEIPKNTSPGFTTIQDPVQEEESELDTELEPTPESEQETGLDLDLNLDHEMEPESELEPEPEPEPEHKFRPRAQTYPRQQYWPQYESMPPNSPTQTQPRTWSVERRHQPMNSYSSQGHDTEDP